MGKMLPGEMGRDIWSCAFWMETCIPIMVPAMLIFVEKGYWTECTAGTKALKRMCAWWIKATAKGENCLV